MRLPKGMSLCETHGMIICKLYNTIIVERIECDRIILRNGGWKTKHTKKCINLVLAKYRPDLKVIQKDFEWFIQYDTGRKIPFLDGMNIAS